MIIIKEFQEVREAKLFIGIDASNIIQIHGSDLEIIGPLSEIGKKFSSTELSHLITFSQMVKVRQI